MLKKINTITKSLDGVIAEFPCNQRYKAIQLSLTVTNEATASMVAQNIADYVEEIRVKLDGKVQQIYSGSELSKLNAVYLELGSSSVDINLTEPWKRTADGEDVLAWGTLDVESFDVEIDYTTAGKALSPLMQIHVDADNIQQALGLIKKFKRRSVTTTGAGETAQITNFDKVDLYTSIHFMGDVTHVKIYVDGNVVFDESKESSADFYKRHKRAHIDGGFSVLFDYDGRGGAGLRLRKYDPKTGALVWQASEFRLEATKATAGNMRVITATVGVKD